MEKKNNLEKNVSERTPVVAKGGYNTVLNKPFEFLYEFGYYTKYWTVCLHKR